MFTISFIIFVKLWATAAVPSPKATMRRSSALVPVLAKGLGAPMAMTAWFAMSLAAATGIVNQHARLSTLPADPTPSPPSSSSSLSGNPFALGLPNANHSLSLIENPTAPRSRKFHIPDSPIDLTLTSFGSPLVYDTVYETIELALDEIANYVALFPTDSITGGLFRWRYDGLEIKVYEYVDREITWYLLNQLLLGIQYWASKLSESCEIRFEIDVQDEGRVGYGSLLEISPWGSDVAKRAANDTSQPLSITSVSDPALTNSTNSSLSPILNDPHLILSYHFFGPRIPGAEVSECFRLARRSIRAMVLRHPSDYIPDGWFDFRAPGSPVSVGVEAYAGNEISWLLLDWILHDVAADLISEGHLFECEFEFEVHPLEDPRGYGDLSYDPEVRDLSRRTRGVDGEGARRRLGR